MVMLAFPALFVVGEPLISRAAETARDGRFGISVIVAGVALGSYTSGVLALFSPAPPIGGLSALVVSTYLTVRYLVGRY
jgi:cation transport ATPase